MEAMYEDKRKKAEEERLEEEEEAKRLENEVEEQKKADYQRTLRNNSSSALLTGDHHNGHLKSDMAQLPVNLPAIEYVKMGRKQVFIYNKLVNRSVIVKPKRFGAESEHPSIYVTRNKVNMPGVTNTQIKAVGALSRHFRKTRATRGTMDTKNSF
jgi:hypothetical protein